MQAVAMSLDTKAVSNETDHTLLSWVVTLTASLFFFYVFIQLNIFNSIDIQLMQAFHLSAPELGQLGAMFFYANAIFLFPAGVILDRFPTKKIILLSVVLTTVGTLIFAIAPTYFAAAAGRFVVGIGGSFCFLSCIRLASRWFPPNKMAFVTGIIVTMAMLGGLVAQTPMALLSNVVGWRNALLLDAGLGVFIFIAILVFVQNYPPHSQAKVKADQAHIKSLGFSRSIKLVLLNPQNWFGGIYTAMLNLPVFLLGAIWGIHYLMQVHQIPVIQASYATTLFFIGVILGAPTFGWFSDLISRRVLPMIIGVIASLVVILTLMYMPNLSFSTIMGLFFLIGFVTSSQVLSYPAIAELNPISLTGTAISIVSVTIMLAGVIFQPLFGWALELNWNHVITDGVAQYAPPDFLNAMLIMPITFVVGLISAFFIKETYCKSQA